MGEAGARARSRTGRLLAVAQGGVEDADVVGVVDLGRDVLRPGLADDRGVVGGAHGRGDDDPTASDPAGRGAGDRRPGLGAAANRGGRPRRRDRPRGRALRRHRSEPDWWERRPRGGVPSSTRRVQCHPRDGCVAIFTQTRLALVSGAGARSAKTDASRRVEPSFLGSRCSTRSAPSDSNFFPQAPWRDPSEHRTKTGVRNPSRRHAIRRRREKILYGDTKRVFCGTRLTAAGGSDFGEKDI